MMFLACISSSDAREGKNVVFRKMPVMPSQAVVMAVMSSKSPGKITTPSFLRRRAEGLEGSRMRAWTVTCFEMRYRVTAPPW